MALDLKERLQQINERIAAACKRSGRERSSVQLIAVTKTHSADIIQSLIDLGVTNIGENRVQEIVEKFPHLHGNFTLHMIGHLQTNKVGPVLEYAKCIQSIDREKLVDRIEHLLQGDKSLDVLIEVNTSGEESKSGCTPDECRALCQRVSASNVLKLRGLMTIGPLNADERAIRNAFSLLRTLAEKNSDLISKPELSMGMSGDFEWAIEEGATMVRVGSSLVGGRN